MRAYDFTIGLLCLSMRENRGFYMRMKSEEGLIYQCFQTMRAFNKSLNSSISDTGIYHSEWTVLRIIADGQQRSQVELAHYMGVEPAAISKTLVKLEAKHLIERKSLDGHRGKFIFITDGGRAVLAPISERVAAHRQHALQGISDQEREEIGRAHV